MNEPPPDANGTPASRLLAQLEGLMETLTDDEERTLLWAILTVAQDVTEVSFPKRTGATEATKPEPAGATEATGSEDVTELSDEFKEAFTPGKVSAIIDYARGPRPGMVGKGTAWSSPAMVGR